MFGIQKKKRHYLVELSREWDSTKFATIYKEYNEAMKQLHKIEIDNDFKQKTSMLKEVYNDSVHCQKIAKKYREEYPLILLFSILFFFLFFSFTP